MDISPSKHRTRGRQQPVGNLPPSSPRDSSLTADVILPAGPATSMAEPRQAGRLCARQSCSRTLPEASTDGHTVCITCRRAAGYQCSVDARCEECRSWSNEEVTLAARHHAPLGKTKAKGKASSAKCRVLGSDSGASPPVPQLSGGESMEVQLSSLLTGGVFRDSLNSIITDAVKSIIPSMSLSQIACPDAQTVLGANSTSTFPYPATSVRPGGLPVDKGRELSLGAGPTDEREGGLGAVARFPSCASTGPVDGWEGGLGAEARLPPSTSTGPVEWRGGRLGAAARFPPSPKRFCAEVVGDGEFAHLPHPRSTEAYTQRSMSCWHHTTGEGLHAQGDGITASKTVVCERGHCSREHGGQSQLLRPPPPMSRAPRWLSHDSSVAQPQIHHFPPHSRERGETSRPCNTVPRVAEASPPTTHNRLCAWQDASCPPPWQRGALPEDVTPQGVEHERQSVHSPRGMSCAEARGGGITPPAWSEEHYEALSTQGEAGEDDFAAPTSVAFREVLEFICDTLPGAREPTRRDKTPNMPGMPPLPDAPEFVELQESEIIKFAMERASEELKHTAASNKASFISVPRFRSLNHLWRRSQPPSLNTELATQLRAFVEPRLSVALKDLSRLEAGVLASTDILNSFIWFVGTIVAHFVPTATTSPQAELLEKTMVYIDKAFTALAKVNATSLANIRSLRREAFLSVLPSRYEPSAKRVLRSSPLTSEGLFGREQVEEANLMAKDATSFNIAELTARAIKRPTPRPSIPHVDRSTRRWTYNTIAPSTSSHHADSGTSSTAQGNPSTVQSRGRGNLRSTVATKPSSFRRSQGVKRGSRPFRH